MHGGERNIGQKLPPFYADVLALPKIPNIGSPPAVGNVSTIAQNSVALNPKQASRYVKHRRRLAPTYRINRLLDDRTERKVQTADKVTSYLMATKNFVLTEAMIREAYAAFYASLEAVRNLTDIMWALNLEPLPPQIYARGADDNALGLANRCGTLAVCILSPAWSDANDDDGVYAAARALMDDVEARAKRLGVYDPCIYLGYAAPWQDVIASYGDDSVAELVALRARVDPDEVFTRRVPGGFKIPS